MHLLRHFSLLAIAAAAATAEVGTTTETTTTETTTTTTKPGGTHERRALPNSPSGGYAPKVVDCPSQRPQLRTAAAVGPQEAEWLSARRNNTIKPMSDFLVRAAIDDFDAAAYISRLQNNISALPNIALAFSGGGYRALMNGAGFIKAADERTPGSTDKGGIGGLLQSSTYIAGLSGGGWLVGSMYNNNFSTIADLQQNPRIWKFDSSIFAGPKTSRSTVAKLFDSAAYWTDIVKQVNQKRDAGFDASLTDYWGRALAYQLIDDQDGGDRYLFSSIAETDDFKKANNPFPIIVADGRAPNTVVISLNSTVFEFNPYEMGSWDPSTYGFAPLQYAASNFSGGVVPPNGKCVRGFDQSSFVMGTSSSLFNQLFLFVGNNSNNNNQADTQLPSVVLNVLKDLASKLSRDDDDIASWQPNPFFGFLDGTGPAGASSIASSEELSLVDGGSDLQNIPLQPLIQPQRAVDVIFAVDSSADTVFNWPNGTAMVATYERSLGAVANGTLFPAVPDAATFVNLGLNNRPTFFGCDVANFSLRAGAAARPPPPLVVYLPNAPYTSGASNASTLTMAYAEAVRDDIIANGAAAAAQAPAAALDAAWPACVACAALHRSLLRTATAVPARCADCFRRYCWDGSVNATVRPADAYQPPLKAGSSAAGTASSAGESPPPRRAAALAAAVVAALAFTL